MPPEPVGLPEGAKYRYIHKLITEVKMDKIEIQLE